MTDRLSRAVKTFACSAVFCALLSQAAAADVTIQVGYGAGGSTDVYSRIASRHLSKYLPGTPDVNVVNVPGAGGKRLLKMAHAASETDGSVIYAVGFTVVTRTVMQDSFDGNEIAKLSPLGSFGRDFPFCWSAKNVAPLDRAALVAPGTKYGATGKGSSTYALPMGIKQALGADFNIVLGYSGAAEVFAALERNEVDLVCGVDPTNPDQFRVAASFTREGLDPAPAYPVILDMIEDDASVELITALTDQTYPSIPFFVAAQTGADTLALYREAFQKLLVDPEFLTDMAATKLDLNPLAAVELDALIDSYATMDEALRDRIIALTE